MFHVGEKGVSKRSKLTPRSSCVYIHVVLLIILELYRPQFIVVFVFLLLGSFKIDIILCKCYLSHNTVLSCRVVILYLWLKWFVASL